MRRCRPRNKETLRDEDGGESGAVGGHGRCSGGVSRHFKRVIWGRVSVKWKANVASYYLFILIFFAADLVSNVMLLQGGPSRGSQARVRRLWLWPERGCWVIISKLLLLARQWWWWWWWWCSFWGRSGCHTHFRVTCNSGASPAQDVPAVMVGVGFLRTLNHTTHLFCSMRGRGEQRSFEEGNEVRKKKNFLWTCVSFVESLYHSHKGDRRPIRIRNMLPPLADLSKQFTSSTSSSSALFVSKMSMNSAEMTRSPSSRPPYAKFNWAIIIIIIIFIISYTSW